MHTATITETHYNYTLLPRQSPRPTLFPFTTLFRSDSAAEATVGAEEGDELLADATQPFQLGRLLPDGREEAPELEGLSRVRSEEHTSELQSHSDLVCLLLLEKKNRNASCDRDTRSP